MLRRLARPALNILIRTQARPIFNSVRPVFTFANSIQNTSKLQNILSQEIKHQEQNKQDLTQFTNFFQNQGWKVNFDGIQIELSKKSGPYNTRVLVNARAPMSYEPEQGQQQGDQAQGQQEQGQNEDFSQVSAFVQKDGTSKWLAIDFILSGESQVQLATATFINDYAAEKAERKKGRIPTSGYQGPEMSTLDERLQQGLYSFIESIGVTGQILQRAGQLSVAYEQQFYLEWLKDLKSLA